MISFSHLKKEILMSYKLFYYLLTVFSDANYIFYVNKGVLNIFHNHESFSGRNGGTTGTGYAR